MIGKKTVAVSQEVINYLENLMLQYRSEMSQISIDISDAARHGDLRENAEFEMAKQREQLKGSQIRQLEIVLSSITLMESSEIQQDYNRVELMTLVQLQNMKTGKSEQVYLVIDALGDVGEVDFNGEQLTPDKISDETPFGSTLMGKSVDSIVKVGDQQYKVLAVEPIVYEEFFK